MNSIEAERLAHAVNALRPDWPTQSLRTWITANLANRAYHDAAVALVWVALDPATHRPARVLENGPWWGATLTAAAEAERHPSAVPIGDLCHTHGVHRDSCGCAGRATPPPWRMDEERDVRQQRTAKWATEIRDELRRSKASKGGA